MESAGVVSESEFRVSNSYPPGPSRRRYGRTTVAGDDGGRSRQCSCFHRLSRGAFSSIPEAAFCSAQRRTSAFRRDVPLLKRSQWDENPRNKKCRTRQVTEMCPAETRGVSDGGTNTDKTEEEKKSCLLSH